MIVNGITGVHGTLLVDMEKDIETRYKKPDLEKTAMVPAMKVVILKVVVLLLIANGQTGLHVPSLLEVVQKPEELYKKPNMEEQNAIVMMG